MGYKISKGGKMHSLPTYIISIPEEEKRYNFIKHQIALFPFLDVHFINPVIGKRLSKEEIQNQYNADLTKQYNEPWKLDQKNVTIRW